MGTEYFTLSSSSVNHSLEILLLTYLLSQVQLAHGTYKTVRVVSQVFPAAFGIVKEDEPEKRNEHLETLQCNLEELERHLETTDKQFLGGTKYSWVSAAKCSSLCERSGHVQSHP